MELLEWLWTGFVVLLIAFLLVSAVILLVDMSKNPARLRAFEQEKARLLQPLVSYIEIHGKWSDEGYRRWVENKREIEGWNEE